MVGILTRTDEYGSGASIPRPQPGLLQAGRLRRYFQSGRAPWRIANGAMGFLTTGAPETPLDRKVAPPAFRDCVRSALAGDLKREATQGLALRCPVDSAECALKSTGVSAAALFVAGALAFGAAKPAAAAAAIILVSTAFFALAAAVRIALVLFGLRNSRRERIPPLPDAELPTVTILAPLFHEAHALPGLIKAIGALDYPTQKLDVKLLLEESDAETLGEARRLHLEEFFDLIIVPPSHPQTKPKACNYGLACARGELIVIYDAEDEPEPAQLRIAAGRFAGAGDRLACVQARLNYYNPDENWLTRLFTLEYCLWFDHFLPALDRIGAPIPLGGTSNIFRTEILSDVGGWDPYNVTEDADLGFRLARRGYQTAIVDSTTFEEANCRLGNWMRQRTRWMKGFMQTWAVARRRRNATAFDWRTSLSVDFLVGGAVFSALLNPVLWALLAAERLGRTAPLADLPDWVGGATLTALAFGNLTLIALAAFAPLRRGLFRLSPAALLMPAYWVMMSVAAWRALLQLFLRPSFWEKTEHGLSEMAKGRRRRALKTFGLEPDGGRGQVSMPGDAAAGRNADRARINQDDAVRLAIPEDERTRQ